jgi:hypothetical protein
VKEAVEGANPPEVARALRELVAAPNAPAGASTTSTASTKPAAQPTAAASPKEDLQTRLTKLTSFAPVMLFMKGFHPPPSTRLEPTPPASTCSGEG